MIRLLLASLLITGCSFVHGSFASGETEPDAGSIDVGFGGDPDAAELAIDANVGIDAAPLSLVMSQTTSATASDGKAVYCHQNLLTMDNAWYRAFKPEDFGITGGYHINKVMFSSEDAKSATVTVQIHAYTGPLGGSTLDTSALTQLASVTGSVPDSTTPQNGHVANLVADIVPGGAFVVEIRSTDVQNAGGIKLNYFHLGANAAGETAPGYYKSSACGIGTPTAQSAGHASLIRVEGTYP